MITVNPITTSSVPIGAYDRAGRLADATAFIAHAGGTDFLVTNRHVVTGLDNITHRSLDRELRRPVSVRWSAQATTGATHAQSVDLYDEDFNPRWLEHSEHGPAADVVAVPLGVHGETELYMARPVDTGSMSSERSVPEISVSNTVFVVGYPLAHNGGLPAAAVWTQGTVASEMQLNVFEHYPTFFIDSTTHQGLSGAPVYALTSERTRFRGPSSWSSGWPPAHIFLGIYSGRAWPNSNLGFVWKAVLVDELVGSGRRADHPERNDAPTLK